MSYTSTKPPKKKKDPHSWIPLKPYGYGYHKRDTPFIFLITLWRTSESKPWLYTLSSNHTTYTIPDINLNVPQAQKYATDHFKQLAD